MLDLEEKLQIEEKLQKYEDFYDEVREFVDCDDDDWRIVKQITKLLDNFKEEEKQYEHKITKRVS